MTLRARPGAALLAIALAACTSSSSDGGGTSPPVSAGNPGIPGGEAPKCTPDAPRYYAFLAEGSCAAVEGSGGTWITSPVFPDADSSIRDAACTFQWIPAGGQAKAGALPDVGALERLGAQFLTRSALATQTCAAPRLGPGSITPVPVDESGGSVGAPTGVTGCDVCGRVFGREVYVILPADKLNLRAIVVPTDSGKFVTFELKLASGETNQTFAVELPAAPDDASYKQGPITLLEAPF